MREGSIESTKIFFVNPQILQFLISIQNVRSVAILKILKNGLVTIFDTSLNLESEVIKKWFTTAFNENIQFSSSNKTLQYTNPE